MQEDAAKLVVAIGGFIGLAFWLIALALYRKIASFESQDRIQSRMPGRSPTEAINDVLEASKQTLLSASPNAATPKITRPADHQLEIERSGLRVRIEAERAGSGSLLTAVVDDSAYTRRWQFWFGVYVLIFMPLVVGGAVAAMWHFVASSPTGAVRWQSFQVVQIAHVLWPPFLFYAVWKYPRTQLMNSISNLMVFAEAAH